MESVLIKSEWQLKECLPVNTNTSLVTLTPAIVQAEEGIIAKAIGEGTLAAVARLVGTEWEEDDFVGRLLRHLRTAAAHLGWWKGFDLLAVQLSETGLQDANGENRAYRYQAENARATLKATGYENLNAAMLDLEDLVSGGGYAETPVEDLRTAYRNSANYSGNSMSLLPTIREMETAAGGVAGGVFSGIGSAPLAARLRPFVTDAENMWLTHWVPETVIRDCVYSVGGGCSATEHYSAERCRAVTGALQRAVMNRALQVATPLLWAELTDKGLAATMPDHGDQTTGEAAPRESADLWQRRFMQAAALWVANAVNVMKKNPELFPEIETYGGGEAKEDGVLRRDNDGKRSVFL